MVFRWTLNTNSYWCTQIPSCYNSKANISFCNSTTQNDLVKVKDKVTNNDLHSPSVNLHIKEYNRNLERSLYTLVLSIKLINFHFEWYTEFHSLTKTHKINTLTFHKESQGQTHNPLSTKHYRIKTLSTEFHHKSKYIMEATRSQTKMFTLHLPCKHRTKYSSSQWRVVTC